MNDFKILQQKIKDYCELIEAITKLQCEHSHLQQIKIETKEAFPREKEIKLNNIKSMFDGLSIKKEKLREELGL